MGKSIVVYTTILHVYCYSTTIQRRGNVGEEMLLARTLKIKFRKEYSSSVYYVTICVLLFYDNTKKILQNDK